MKVLKALVVALIAGLAVVVPINSVPWWEPFRFWGLFFGSFAALFVFGLALWFFGRRTRRAGLAGRYFAAFVGTVFGALITMHNVAWGMPLTSLEGMWLWPLAIVPFVLVFLILRPARRKRSVWDEPPSQADGVRAEF